MTDLLPEAVFLDLDGTLVDPKPGITGSIAHALEQVGIAPPDPDTLGWAIGPPLRETFARLGAPDPEAVLAQYRARYGGGAMFDVSVYPGVPRALAALGGHRLFLATAKPHVFARQITAHVGLSAHLEAEFGPEMDGTREDKAELLTHACAQLGLAPERCVMVGDRDNDLRAARANGMGFVAALWGYGAPGELDGADIACAAPADLPAAIAQMGKALPAAR